jgi:nucleotide-binding universal stress UspA family protein
MKRFFPCKILLLLDDSEEADSATGAAVELSRQTGSELHVVAVGNVKAFHTAPEIAWEQGSWAALENEARSKAGRVLGEHIRKIEEWGGEVAAEHLLIGQPAEEIIRLREQLGAGLVIIGGRKTGFVKKTLTRSVGEEIVRNASCDVLVVHDGRSESARRRLRLGAYSLNHAIWRLAASWRIRNLPNYLGCAEREGSSLLNSR